MISFPFDSIETVLPDETITYDRAVGSEVFGEYMASFFTNGIHPTLSRNLQVSAGQGMTTIVNPGVIFINGRFGLEKSLREMQHTSSEDLDRIDTIVARLDKLDRKIDLYVVKGDKATLPSPKPPVRSGDIYELVLANVFIPKLTADIKNERIEDTRLNTNLCGIVSFVGNKVDTTAIFNQFQAALDEYLSIVEKAIDGTLAGYLQAQINEKLSKRVFTLTIAKSKWIKSATSGLYYQQIEVIGMKESYYPDLFYITTINDDSKLEIEQANKLIQDLITFNGYIKVYVSSIPRIDLPIRLEVKDILEFIKVIRYQGTTLINAKNTTAENITSSSRNFKLLGHTVHVVSEATTEENFNILNATLSGSTIVIEATGTEKIVALKESFLTIFPNTEYILVLNSAREGDILVGTGPQLIINDIESAYFEERVEIQKIKGGENIVRLMSRATFTNAPQGISLTVPKEITSGEVRVILAMYKATDYSYFVNATQPNRQLTGFGFYDEIKFFQSNKNLWSPIENPFTCSTPDTVAYSKGVTTMTSNKQAESLFQIRASIIPLEKQYTVSFEYMFSGSAPQECIVYTAGVFGTARFGAAAIPYATSYTRFTTTVNRVIHSPIYLAVRIDKGSANSVELKIRNLQIELGEKATEYVEHQGKSMQVSYSPVSGSDVMYIAKTGNIADEMDFANKTITVRNKTFILSQLAVNTWEMLTDATSKRQHFRTIINEGIPGVGTPVLATGTRYYTEDWRNPSLLPPFVSTSDANVCKVGFTFDEGTFADTTAFYNWLRTQNISRIQLPLQNPVIKQLIFNDIISFDGETTYYFFSGTGSANMVIDIPTQG